MKRYVAATLLIVGLAAPAFAAEHYAVMDTVGNCSVIDTLPSHVSGLKILAISLAMVALMPPRRRSSRRLDLRA